MATSEPRIPLTEHDGEPVPGLPARLPKGEHILWQGAPEGWAVASTVFHTKKIALYFALIAAWRVIATLYDGGTTAEAAVKAVILVGLGILAAGFFMIFAWLVQKTTVYTITNRRVVMRIGVALSLTLHIPFTKIEGAAMRLHRNGRTGDIPLTLIKGERISYAVLWPHARPWRFARPEPTLRAIPEPQRVAEILGSALAATVDGRSEKPVSRVAGGATEKPAKERAGTAVGPVATAAG